MVVELQLPLCLDIALVGLIDLFKILLVIYVCSEEQEMLVGQIMIIVSQQGGVELPNKHDKYGGHLETLTHLVLKD